MDYQTPESVCQLCGSSFSRKGMTRHISSCLKKELKNRNTSSSRTYYHLHVFDPSNPDYFLHLLIEGNTTLQQLDNYLRSIWLECCGHLSAFFEPGSGSDTGKDRSISSVFRRFSDIQYEYDFGSTTYLVLRKVGVYDGSPDIANRINLLARNSRPVIPCEECGRYPAVTICSECQWDGCGWLCEKCAKEHECDEDLMLSVANSPRAGVCAYWEDDFNEEEFRKPVFSDKAANRKRAISAKGKSTAGKGTVTPDKKTDNQTGKIENQLKNIKSSIQFFCRRYLDEELEGFAIDLLEELSEDPVLNIARGQTQIWAASIILVIARLNFLLDDMEDSHVTVDDICSFFETKPTTIQNKARSIEAELGLMPGDSDYCRQDVIDSLIFNEPSAGFLSMSNSLWDMDPFPADQSLAAMDIEELQQTLQLYDKELPLGDNGEIDLEKFLDMMVELVCDVYGLSSDDIDSNLVDYFFKEIQAFLPDDMEKDIPIIRERVLEYLKSRSGKIRPFPGGMLDSVDKEQLEEMRKKEEKQQQQKIAEEEKERIRKGQISIFDYFNKK